LSADQVTAEDKEKIDADPAETMDLSGQREAHDPGVVNDDDEDRQGAEKIETRLALALREARIDRNFDNGLRDAARLADGFPN